MASPGRALVLLSRRPRPSRIDKCDEADRTGGRRASSDGRRGAPGVQADRPGTMGPEIEEEEAIHHGELAVVLDRPEAAWQVEVAVEVGDRHLAGAKERDGPGEQPEA